MVTVEGRLKYYADLRYMETRYLLDCDDVMRDEEVTGTVFYKLNVHRLVELVTRTIPTFVHARNSSEVVLELMHQEFKK